MDWQIIQNLGLVALTFSNFILAAMLLVVGYWRGAEAESLLFPALLIINGIVIWP